MILSQIICQRSWSFPAVVIDNADTWHIDLNRLVVAGFSAGGHLAACAITLSEFRPAAAILTYPVILPEAVDVCLPEAPYPGEHVTDQTCPCFLIAARDDDIVDIRNTAGSFSSSAAASLPDGEALMPRSRFNQSPV